MRIGYAAIFLPTALTAGAVYWAATNETHWWAGYDDPIYGFVPKFKLKWYEQMIESGVVGVGVAIAMTAVRLLLNCGSRLIDRETQAGVDGTS
jgi:hypothetical protein